MQKHFDVMVIGGGPAGIIAAGQAARSGARVVLIEKNNDLGRKLLLTGNGRCNITNAEFNLHKLISRYGENGKFLYSAFSEFGVAVTMNFFESIGLELNIEGNGRVFPRKDRSEEVLKVLFKYLMESRISIMRGNPVMELVKENGFIRYAVMENGNIISADIFAICTGGKSYPHTGSTGDGYEWAASLGHGIVTLMPALVPIKTGDKWVKELQGVGLEKVGIKVLLDDQEKITTTGSVLFTHFGLSGPEILDISRDVGKLLYQGEVKILLDLKPEISCEELDDEILEEFESKPNKSAKTSIDFMFPKRLATRIIQQSRIPEEKKVNSIRKDERRKLIHTIRNLEITVSGLQGFDQAVITTGGIDLGEVDPKTMASRIIDNLYFAGEILDLDGPTGGYNLQLCWSTGYVAGKSISRRFEELKNNRS
jgi:predicted Rossmann fold flavoprotein